MQCNMVRLEDTVSCRTIASGGVSKIIIMHSCEIFTLSFRNIIIITRVLQLHQRVVQDWYSSTYMVDKVIVCHNNDVSTVS